jgi:hypothetical protein
MLVYMVYSIPKSTLIRRLMKVFASFFREFNIVLLEKDHAELA